MEAAAGAAAPGCGWRPGVVPACLCLERRALQRASLRPCIHPRRDSLRAFLANLAERHELLGRAQPGCAEGFSGPPLRQARSVSSQRTLPGNAGTRIGPAFLRSGSRFACGGYAADRYTVIGDSLQKFDDSNSYGSRHHRVRRGDAQRISGPGTQTASQRTWPPDVA